MIFVRPRERCSSGHYGSLKWRHCVQGGWMTHCRHREPLTERKDTAVLTTYLMFLKGSKVILRILPHFAFSTLSTTAYLCSYNEDGK